MKKKENYIAFLWNKDGKLLAFFRIEMKKNSLRIFTWNIILYLVDD